LQKTGEAVTLRRSCFGGDVRRFLLPGALCLLLAAPALAQNQSAPFIIDRARSDRQQLPPAPPQPPLAQPAPGNANQAITPFTLSALRIEGTSLAPAALEGATRSFIGKRIAGAADLTAIAQAVSDAYAGQGDIALYTVTVPAQDFSGGLMRLVVTEGFIEHVDLAGDTGGDVSRVVALANKLTLEKPLRRSTLQRYLSLIRDLPGLTVEAQMLQGGAPGAVRLVLTLKQKPYALALTIINGGNPLLGRTQLQADLSLYNLLREGEETKLTFGTSTIFSRYQYFGVSDSQALDDEGTRAALSYGYLRTDLGAISLSGQAQTLQLAVSHPLIRSFDENLSVSAGLDGLDSKNALIGLLLSSEHVRALRAAAGYSLTDPKSALTLSASLSQGLDFADARSSLGQVDFQKLVLQAGYNRLLDEEWVVRLKAVTQLAGAALPVSELFALGGADYGRAFLAASALGDSALAGSLEIGFLPKGLPTPLTGLEAFVFADDGATWLRSRGAGGAGYHLASAGAGIRLPIGTETKLELAAANALSADAPGTRAGSWRLILGLSSSF
jgi:hemolysin activation/secretion protein